MPKSTGQIGYGSSLEYATEGSGSFTALAQVVDIKLPGIKIKSIDISNNDSPDAAMEKVPGMIDAGQCTFSCVYKKATYAALMAMLRVRKDWRITFGGDDSTDVFTGFISDLGAPVPLDDKQVIDVTIEASGLPVFTQGA